MVLCCLFWCQGFGDVSPFYVFMFRFAEWPPFGKEAGTLPRIVQKSPGERTGLMVRASDSESGDPDSILGRVGVLFP